MRLKQPDLWFLVALLVITAAGAVLLAQTGAVDPDARHLSYFRHYWQAAFDALSAACGVGMLTYSFYEDYTPLGRWILTGLGVAGALLFVAAVTHAVGRTVRHGRLGREYAGPIVAVVAFVVTQAVAVGVFLLLTGFEHAPENAWRAIAAFSSLGWGTETPEGVLQSGALRLPAWPLALLAWIGALGWPLWLFVVPALFKRWSGFWVQAVASAPRGGRRVQGSGSRVQGSGDPRFQISDGRLRTGRALLVMVGGYTAWLLLAALLICAFETPRGSAGRGEPNDTLSGQPLAPRYVRSLVQTAAASGAGMPTESLAERDTSDGTKFTLSALLLVGGLGGSATGGMQWTLLLWALAGAAAALGWLGKEKAATDVARWMHAGLACLLLLVLLALVVAVGLLLIENWTASRYQPPPSFADALLDASSIVAGGNLSSGLTESVTSRNLLSGIRQSANLYQYGMAWLMLAMLAGRLLPLVVLRRLGSARPAAGKSSSEAAQADSI